jgi:hypothetical protein
MYIAACPFASAFVLPANEEAEVPIDDGPPLRDDDDDDGMVVVTRTRSSMASMAECRRCHALA